MIAAVAALDGGHRRTGAASDLDAALAIGYELESLGAPQSYAAALRARGGPEFAERVLRTAAGYRGGIEAGVAIPPESDPFDRPVDGAVRAGFGQLFGRPHLGMDFDARGAEQVRAAAAGVVTEVGSVLSYGRYICLLHSFPRGLRGQKALTTCYGYLSSADRELGDAVREGERVATPGCSGQTCLSPRVHFIVRLGERPDGLPRGSGALPSSRPAALVDCARCGSCCRAPPGACSRSRPQRPLRSPRSDSSGCGPVARTRS